MTFTLNDGYKGGIYYLLCALCLNNVWHNLRESCNIEYEGINYYKNERKQY